MHIKVTTNQRKNQARNPNLQQGENSFDKGPWHNAKVYFNLVQEDTDPFSLDNSRHQRPEFCP
jgi:hypothetical protein